MKLVPYEQIRIEDRARKEFAPKELADLKRSIAHKGLLHAPVLTSEFKLLAGERRIRAMMELHEEGNEFTHDGQIVTAGRIPYTLVQELSPADFLEAELEENVLRSELNWQELTSARVRIHELRKSLNPEQSQKETAEEIAEVRGTTVAKEQSALARAIILEKHKDDPRVQRAPNESAAYRAILDRADKQFKAQLAKKVGYVSPHIIINGDAFKEMKKFNDRQFDAIICDPPYGIEADTMGGDSKHFYDDSAETALKFCENLLLEGFRITKPQAVLFMFCDIEHFVHLREYAKRMAWSPWRTPLTWSKGGTDGGNAPWGRGGFVRTSEWILFATKGGATLRNPGGADVLPFRKVSRGDRHHAAEKPRELLEELIRLSCLPDALVLDPCAGSGSIIPAADKFNVRVTAIELDETYYASCVERANAKFTGEDTEGDMGGVSSEMELGDDQLGELLGGRK